MAGDRLIFLTALRQSSEPGCATRIFIPAIPGCNDSVESTRSRHIVGESAQSSNLGPGAIFDKARIFLSRNLKL